MSAPLIQIDFNARPAARRVARGIYQDPRTGAFYERPYVHGRRTWRKLDARTLTAAERERSRNRDKQIAARSGLAPDPYQRILAATVSDLCAFYLEAGCPKSRMINQPRSPQTDREERARVATLKAWWGGLPVHSVTLDDCRQYHKHRTGRFGPGPGDRQVDKELVTLSNIFRWAVQNAKKTGVTSNPIRHDRPRFRDPNLVKHCRDAMPESADELHALARYLFQSDRGAVLGWQLLLQAFIGPRAGEILRLRWDGKTKKDPGYISGGAHSGALHTQGRYLYLYASTSSKGTFEHIKIHAALDQALGALRAWRDQNYPSSPWFFPSPADPSRPVGSTALTHALARICPAMGLPKRTSHGLRAYYVNVLRSRGIPDAEVALRIGQKSGGKLIVDVYGLCPEDELTWLPISAPPAWEDPPVATQTEFQF